MPHAVYCEDGVSLKVAYDEGVDFRFGPPQSYLAAPVIFPHRSFDALRDRREATFAPGVAMATGTVKFFNRSKGFGFIQPEDGSKDVFVHMSAVERAGLDTLNENQKISYEVEQGSNGKSAAANLKAL
jgi:CspA family cold shock protein